MKIKFQISKSFVRFEQNYKISNQITNKKFIFKFFSNMLPDSRYLETVTKNIPWILWQFSILKDILKLKQESNEFL